MKIKIDHIAKIEGHGGFVGEIIKGDVKAAIFMVNEGARLLEGILRDRHYEEASQIAARICGVCPVVHTLTSIKALEDAMGVVVNPETIYLRKLLMLAQLINSHALHLFFFSLADFFGDKDDLVLIKKFPSYTKNALQVREFGNLLIDKIGGRSIHPLAAEIGGFKKWPTKEILDQILTTAKDVLPAAIRLANLFARLKYPKLQTDFNWASLVNENEYAIYGGDIRWNGKNKEGQDVPAGAFMKLIKEFQVKANPQTKRSHFEEEPFLVGAIARLNNNSPLLNPEAGKILKLSGINLPSDNPLHNILGQAVEIVHCVEEIIKMIEQNEKLELNKAKNVQWSAQAGRGYGAIEAPRGLLFYFYETKDNGDIKECNIITPTAQNIARLEEDLRIWLPELAKKTSRQKEALIKMLIRGYDPCLTCATH